MADLIKALKMHVAVKSFVSLTGQICIYDWSWKEQSPPMIPRLRYSF